MSDIGRAFAAVLADVTAAARPGAIRACARYLARVRHLHEAPEILAVTERELLAKQGRTLARVQSADDLSPVERTTVERHLQALLGMPVTGHLSVRPSLLAGFRAEVDGQMVDASLRGVLSRLRAELRAWTPHLLEENNV